MDEIIQKTTAILAKEVGFKELTEYYYNYNNNNLITNIALNNYNYNDSSIHYSAPTQTTLQRWLREIHDIHIYIEAYDESGVNVYQPTIVSKITNEEETESDDYFETYELALEEALVDSLNIVKNKMEIKTSKSQEKLYTVEQLKYAYRCGLRNGSIAGGNVASNGDLYIISADEWFEKYGRDLNSPQNKY